MSLRTRLLTSWLSIALLGSWSLGFEPCLAASDSCCCAARDVATETPGRRSCCEETPPASDSRQAPAAPSVCTCRDRQPTALDGVFSSIEALAVPEAAPSIGAARSIAAVPAPFLDAPPRGSWSPSRARAPPAPGSIL